jgi:hypothetical protein
MAKALSGKQQLIYEFLRSFVEEKDYPRAFGTSRMAAGSAARLSWITTCVS